MKKGKMFFKIVCESVDVFGKEVIVDKNCGDMDEVHKVVMNHPELLSQNVTWILYPMQVIA